MNNLGVDDYQSIQSQEEGGRGGVTVHWKCGIMRGSRDLSVTSFRGNVTII